MGKDEGICIYELSDVTGKIYKDDVNEGVILPTDLVMKATYEEVGFMNKRGLWDIKSVKECWEKTGKPPVSVRWVRTNKAHPVGIDIRCRLVARDFKGGENGRDDLFAETPPLEAKRMLLSLSLIHISEPTRR